MLDVYGDLWTYKSDAICITTNGFVTKDGLAVMGRGCAKEASDRFPAFRSELGRRLRESGNVPFVFYFANEQRPVVSFPVKPAFAAGGKPGWKAAAQPHIIEASAKRLVELADIFGWKTVALPRPGCGNGHLKYEDVRALLDPILDDRFHIITNEEHA